jgi:hypothetical protein
MKSEKKWSNPEIITMIATTIIAIVSVVIAGLALWISWEDHKETRENNRTAVMPFLVAVGDTSSEDSRIGIALCNNGLGPARIIKLQLFDDGKPLPALESGAFQAVLNNHPEIKGAGITRIYSLTPGVIIRAGEQEYLLYITPSDTNSPDATEFEEALSHMTFYVQYESFYHEPGELTYNGSGLLLGRSKDDLQKLNSKLIYKK